MTKSTVSCPSARIAAAISRPASRSVRPGLRNSAIRACTRSIACPGAAQRVDLLGRLAHPQVAEDLGGEACSAPGSASRNREHLLGPHPVGQPDPPGLRAAGRPTMAYGSSVSAQPTTSMPRAATAEASTAGTSSCGATRNGSPSAGSTRQVSRSRGSAS